MQVVSNQNYFRLTLVAVMALLISLSWLIFPYFIQGKQLLRGVGDDSRLIQGNSVSRYFSRILVQNPVIELSATFATDEYFQFVDNAGMIGNMRPDKNYIFFVSENIHEGQLTTALPEVALIVGQTRYTPARAVGPDNVDHHRVTMYSFPKRDAQGELINLAQAENIHLEVANHYFDSVDKYRFLGTWSAPYSLPNELKTRAHISLIGMTALGAGLLSSVLTPCLLQLVVMFATVIGGFSTVPVSGDVKTAELTPVVRHKIMRIAIAFVVSFVLLYMLAGALIGAIGHQAQLVFAEFSRPISIVSGVIVIALGLWLGLRSTRPLACKVANGLHHDLQNNQAMRSLSTKDTIATVVTSVGYALGCTVCFGGAIVATLIIYVGAIGSAAIGAGIMLMFSLGVAIPFLLAAYYLSRMNSVLVFLAEKSRVLSLVGMVVVMALGTILLTDNFHVISDAIYPYLGLNGGNY